MMRSVEIVLTADENRFIGVRDPSGRWWYQLGPQSEVESAVEADTLRVLTFEEPGEDAPDELDADHSEVKPGQLP